MPAGHLILNGWMIAALPFTLGAAWPMTRFDTMEYGRSGLKLTLPRLSLHLHVYGGTTTGVTTLHC